MANYVNSNLLKAQAILNDPGFGSADKRFRIPEVFNYLTAQAPIMFPESTGLRTREDRAVEAYYKERTQRALGSARSHDHTGTRGAMGVLNPTWNTNTDEFAISLKQADNNLLSYEDMFRNELDNVVANFAEGLEFDAVQFLFDNKTGVNAAVSEGVFNGTNDVFEVAAASDEKRLIQISKSVMKENKYNPGYTIIADPVAFNKAEFFAAQGTSNAENLTFQYPGISNVICSVELGAAQNLAFGGAYSNGFWLVIPNGMAAALNWIPRQNREGEETKVNVYGSIQNPADGLTYAVHEYEERADCTSTNGYTQDVELQFQFSIDISFDYAPLSTANETPIIAIGLV